MVRFRLVTVLILVFITTADVRVLWLIAQNKNDNMICFWGQWMWKVVEFTYKSNEGSTWRWLQENSKVYKRSERLEGGQCGWREFCSVMQRVLRLMSSWTSVPDEPKNQHWWEIWDSHGGQNYDIVVLGWDTVDVSVSVKRNISIFRHEALHYFRTQKSYRVLYEITYEMSNS